MVERNPVILKIRYDLGHLLRFKRRIKINRSEIYSSAMQWYLKYLRKRFIQMSNGGWVPLADSTIQRKKRRKKLGYIKGNPRWILRETLTLYNNLTAWTTTKGFTVGYKGGLRHPGTPDRKKKKPTVAQLAAWHQFGIGRLSKRVIVPKPTKVVVDSIRKEIEKQYGKIIEGTRR